MIRDITPRTRLANRPMMIEQLRLHGQANWIFPPVGALAETSEHKVIRSVERFNAHVGEDSSSTGLRYGVDERADCSGDVMDKAGVGWVEDSRVVLFGEEI